jgi:hypothetical protein
MKYPKNTTLFLLLLALFLMMVMACDGFSQNQTLPVASPPAPSATPISPDAWVWTGTIAQQVATVPTFSPTPRPDKLVADLRGDGQPVWAVRDTQGVVRVYDGPPDDNAPLLWQNEAENWHIGRLDVGDPNNDGRIEYLLLLWKPDASGTIRSHPFLMGWRGGHYRIIWGGSATHRFIQDLAVDDLDADGEQELVVLEGGSKPGDMGEVLSVWHWHGWGFQQEWQSPPGRWNRLVLQDVTGDAHPDIVAYVAERSSSAGSTSIYPTP